MIIIATDEEKIALERFCGGFCNKCPLGFLMDNGNCPIENKQIVIVDKECSSNQLIRGRENNG